MVRFAIPMSREMGFASLTWWVTFNKFGKGQVAAVCAVCLLALSGSTGCGSGNHPAKYTQGLALTMIGSGESPLDLEFTNQALAALGQQRGIHVKNLVAYDTIDERLELFEELFKQKSSQPDICKIDTIWPGALANDLIDLRPYLGDELNAIAPELLRYFTVDGRLVGLPVTIDTGILYYRTDLLRRYGYLHPPQTWDELERMAAVIQRGERRSGNKDFWGFVWQGVQTEALTCNALEWQVAEGGGDLLQNDQTVNVANRRCRRAIERAASWVGTISPPGVIEYDEDDSQYLWQAGNAAFLRSWVGFYQLGQQPSSLIRGKYETAPLPSGARTRAWTFGGMALGVSKYSRHPREAAEAIRFLVSADIERRRTRSVGQVPTRSALLEDQDLLAGTAFHGEFGKQWREGLFERPSILAGKNYDLVSRAYAKAVHSILKRQVPAAQAMAELQGELVRLTGFRAVVESSDRRSSRVWVF
jgi:trehalose/maltose transport system substrate-binding protein